MNLNLAAGTGTVEVADATFGKEFNEALVHQVVTALGWWPSGYTRSKEPFRRAWWW